MRVWHWDVELKKRLDLGHGKASFVYPSVGHYTKHASSILKGNATRIPTWSAWYVQPGVAPFEPHHKDRQLWRWLAPSERKQGKKVGLVGITGLNEAEWPQLDWKTFFKRDPKLREPIASWQASGNTQAPPKAPPQHRKK